MSREFIIMFAMVTGAVIAYVLCSMMALNDIKKELGKIAQKLYDIEKKLM